VWTALLAGAGFKLQENFREVGEIIGPIANIVLAGLVLIYVSRLILNKGEEGN
jgi:hypothetical protein